MSRRPHRAGRTSETAIQRNIAAYLRLALGADVAWTAFPAGGGGRIRGARLKAMGLQPGWPDIIILYRPRPYLEMTLAEYVAASNESAARLLGLEVKTATGRLSDEQREVHKQIREAGGQVEVVRSIAETAAALARHGVPMRANVRVA